MQCPICLDVKNSIFIFKCGHRMCLECFLMYCESKLNSRDLILVDQIGFTLSCPYDCTNSYIDNCHYFHILSSRDYERYQDFAAEEFVLKNGGVICPKANCSQAMLIDKVENCTKVCCISCNHLFCILCKGDYHEGPCSTDVYLDSIRTSETTTNGTNKGFAQLLKDKINALTWTKKDEVNKIEIKRCPNSACRCPTERDSGCLHITCKCNLDWCWLCEKPWDYECMANHWFDWVCSWYLIHTKVDWFVNNRFIFLTKVGWGYINTNNFPP